MDQDQLREGCQRPESGGRDRHGEALLPVKVELDEHEYQYDGGEFFANSESVSHGLEASRVLARSSDDRDRGTHYSKKTTKSSRSKKHTIIRKYKHRSEVKKRKKPTAVKAVKASKLDTRNNDDSTGNLYEDPLSLTCSICSKTSKDQRLLKHHMKVVHTQDPRHCEKCGKIFKNIELLKVHNRRNHSSKSKSYEERLMKDRARKILRRKSRKIPGANICCVICSVEFPYRSALKSHEETEHNSTEGLICPKCRRGFTHIEALKYHVRRAHLEAVNQTQTVTCDICQLVLKNSKVLKAHLKKVHLNRTVAVNGALEAAAAAGHDPTPGVSNSHLLPVQVNDGTVHHHQCEFCPSNFRWKNELTLHYLQVHGRKELIICGECGKGFSNQINFIEHYKTHSSDDIWACQLCDKLFRNQKHQHRHERKVHRKAGTYPYDECVTYALQSPAALENHARLKHPDFPDRLKHKAPIRPRKENNKTWSLGRDHSSPFTSLIDHNNRQEETPKVARSESRMEGSRMNQKNVFESQSEPPDWNHVRTSTMSDTHSNCGNAPHAEEGDDWFGWDVPIEHSPPSSPTTCDIQVTIPCVMTSAHQVSPQSQHKEEQENLELSQPQCPQYRVVQQKVDLEALKHCPKLKLRISVEMKKYMPLPYRKGFHFCDICCLNFVNGRSLGLHVERCHGIKYVPKKPTKAIADALKHLRSKYTDDCVSAQFKKSKPRKSKSDAKSSLEDELEILSPVELAQTSQQSADAVPGPNPESEPELEIQETFSCDLCEKTYDTKRKLQDHRRLVHADMQQTCYICKTVLANSQYLNRHMRWVHFHDPVVCDICGKEYGSALKLGMHKRRVHRAQIFTCTICRSDHKTKGSLRLHMRMTHEDDGTRFNCGQCPRTFKRKESCRRHLEESHARKDTSNAKFQCDLCGRCFQNATSMKNHRKNHTVEENFRCLFCSAKFNTKKKKAAHENKYHWQEEGYICKVCNQVCENARALEKHVIYQHSEQQLETLYYEPALACPPMPVRNYQQYKHPLIEPGSVPPFRPSTTRRERGDPKSWNRLSEEEKKARFKEYYHAPKSCTHCGKVCANRHEIYKHIADMHPEMARIRCEECNLAFVIAKFLHIHNSEVHNIAPPLMCALCGERFFAPDMQRYHMNKHHGGSPKHQTPRTCESCGKQLATKAAMQRHQQIQHGHLSAPTNDCA